MEDFGIPSLVQDWLESTSISAGMLSYAKSGILLLGLLLLCTLVYFFVRRILLRVIEKLVRRDRKSVV